MPSESPPNTVIKSTSTSTIDVSWEPINQAYVHGVLLGYDVRYAKDEGSPLNWETETLDADTHEVVLRDLAFFTGYKVMVCAKTSKGCGKEYSDIAYTFGDGELNTNVSNYKDILTIALLRLSLVAFFADVNHLGGTSQEREVHFHRFKLKVTSVACDRYISIHFICFFFVFVVICCLRNYD